MNRDDEHCTALMLAALEGHTIVMRYLLDNHASVNDVDKMRVTTMHHSLFFVCQFFLTTHLIALTLIIRPCQRAGQEDQLTRASTGKGPHTFWA